MPRRDLGGGTERRAPRRSQSSALGKLSRCRASSHQARSPRSVSHPLRASARRPVVSWWYAGERRVGPARAAEMRRNRATPAIQPDRTRAHAERSRGWKRDLHRGDGGVSHARLTLRQPWLRPCRCHHRGARRTASPPRGDRAPAPSRARRRPMHKHRLNLLGELGPRRASAYRRAALRPHRAHHAAPPS